MFYAPLIQDDVMLANVQLFRVLLAIFAATLAVSANLWCHASCSPLLCWLFCILQLKTSTSSLCLLNFLYRLVCLPQRRYTDYFLIASVNKCH